MSHYIFIYILMSTNSALDLSIWTSQLGGILPKGRVFLPSVIYIMSLRIGYLKNSCSYSYLRSFACICLPYGKAKRLHLR